MHKRGNTKIMAVRSRRRNKLDAARAAAEEEEANRRELFGSINSTTATSARQRQSEEQAAQNVTESLLELRQSLHAQVQQSQSTVHELDRSSQKLGRTKDEMDTISSNVKVSHSLITKFGGRERTDKLLIFLGLVFFFGVVLYIIRKRLIGWII